jgi:hypothetical protein
MFRHVSDNEVNGGEAMLQMKKNTTAKIATMIASVAALGTIFGVIHRGSPTATTADAQQASVSVAPTATQAASSSQRSTQSTIVHTRTRAS